MLTRLLLILAIPCALYNPSVLSSDDPAPITPVAKTGNGEWTQKHAAYVAAAKRGDIPLVLLGDSITDYWSTTGKEVWDMNFSPMRAANFGIAADKVENILWRVE